jgi:hypothetical protein
MKMIMMIILKFKYTSLTLKVRNILNPEWRGSSGDNSYASSLIETERVFSSSAAHFLNQRKLIKVL